MAEINWSDPGSSSTSYLTTELNALASAAGKLGAAIDNDAGKRWAMIEVTLAEQASARSTGGHIDLYAIKSADGGTTYGYGADALTPGSHDLLGALEYDAAVTARVATGMFMIPAGHFKLLVINSTGQALAATTNTVKYALFSEETN